MWGEEEGVGGREGIFLSCLQKPPTGTLWGPGGEAGLGCRLRPRGRGVGTGRWHGDAPLSEAS